MHLDSISAGTIQGKISNERHQPVSSADIILFNTTNRKDIARVKKSDDKGFFRFYVDDVSRVYRLIAFKNDNRGEILIDYRGQETDLDIQIGKKWYESQVFTTVKNVIGFLISFFVGLFSREIGGWLKKRKYKKSILSIYGNSLQQFINQYMGTKNISSYDNEKVYIEFFDKFMTLKQNLENLLNYSWAVENMNPHFFDQMQKRLYLIKDMENTVPFDTRKEHWRKLMFLKEHHEKEDWPPELDEHQNFEKLLQMLQEDLRKL
jgi:hypothetical protein